MKETSRFNISPELAERLKEMEKQTRKRVAEIREEVTGQKEEFDISEYYRLRYGVEKKSGEIPEDISRSIEEDYYLGHREINNIADLVDYHELYEND